MKEEYKTVQDRMNRLEAKIAQEREERKELQRNVIIGKEIHEMSLRKKWRERQKQSWSR